MTVYQKVNKGTLLSKIKNNYPLNKKLKLIVNQMRTIMSCDQFHVRRYNNIAYIEHDKFYQYSDEIFKENDIHNRRFDSNHDYLIYYNKYYIKDKRWTPRIETTSFKHYDDMRRDFKSKIDGKIKRVDVEIEFDNHFLSIRLNKYILLQYNMELIAIGIIDIDNVIEMIHDICSNKDVINVFKVLNNQEFINKYSRTTPIFNLTSANKSSIIYKIIKNIDKYKMISDYDFMMKSYNPELFTKLKLLCKKVSTNGSEMERFIFSQRVGPFKVDVYYKSAQYFRNFSWMYTKGCEDGGLNLIFTFNRETSSLTYGLNEDTSKCSDVKTGIISYILTTMTGHKAFMNQLNQKMLA